MFWPQRQEDEMDLKRGMRIYRIFTEVAMTIWWQNTFFSSTRGWELLFLGASDPTTAALSAPGDEPNDVQRSKMPPSTYYWRQTGVDKPVHTHARTCKHTHACTSPSAEKHQEPGGLYQITASTVESWPHESHCHHDWAFVWSLMHCSQLPGLDNLADNLHSVKFTHDLINVTLQYLSLVCRWKPQDWEKCWFSSFWIETMWQNKQLWNVALC